MNSRKLLAKVIAGRGNVKFKDVSKLAEAFGFRLDRVSGSHHIFVHADVPELLNLQNVGGNAKVYQVRQLLSLVEKYGLKLENR